MSISENNKRIARNTMILYIRTLFVMLISLYTSRVILQVLGVEDYGVYQVVGGMVSMFSVISVSLSSAISRFITFEIGHGDRQKLERIFATSVVIQLILAVVVFVVAEILGYWFMQTQMQIPEGRMQAARWVLHCSLITFCINLISVPYNACIVAHEHMKAFAYVSLIEVIFKLVVCFLLFISPIDKLVFYAVLLTLVAVLIRLIYGYYCHKHFEESRVNLIFDRQIFNEMFGFAGWSFFSNTAHIFNSQGVNMLMNVYFGVTVNAARGIANQIESAVLQFVRNFTTAINPQITKSYASGELEKMHLLVCRGAKFSYFAMLIMALPLICEMEYILSIWLVEVPEYTVIFSRLLLLVGMLECVGSSGFTACMATGKLKKYALVITSIGGLEFPLSWLLFKLGAPVVSTYYLYVIITFLVLVARMFLLQNMVGLSVKMYVKQVFIPMLGTTIVAIWPSLFIVYALNESILRLIFSIIVGVLISIFSVLYIGMTKNERDVILSKVLSIIYRFKNK